MGRRGRCVARRWAGRDAPAAGRARGDVLSRAGNGPSRVGNGFVAPQQLIGPFRATGRAAAHPGRSMAARPDAKRDAAAPRRAPSAHKHVERAYVAKEVVDRRAVSLCAGAGRRRPGGLVGRGSAARTDHARQLATAGLGRGAIASRRALASLHPIFRGVYLVGHDDPAPGALELAAVLACGVRAFVSHRSAAALWGLATAAPRVVEVTVIRARTAEPRDGLASTGCAARPRDRAPAERHPRHRRRRARWSTTPPPPAPPSSSGRSPRPSRSQLTDRDGGSSPRSSARRTVPACAACTRDPRPAGRSAAGPGPVASGRCSG